MYDIAVAVALCLRAHTRVDVAWVVDSDLEPSASATEAVGLTPGGGRLGRLLNGALDDRLTEAGSGRLVTIELDPLEVNAIGRRGSRVSCLVVPADSLPEDLWKRLVAREPIGLMTRLDGDRVISTTSYAVGSGIDSETGAESIDPADQAAMDLLARGASGAVRTHEGVITVLCPVPRLAILGGGPIVDAIAAVADVLGWSVQVGDVITIGGLAASLTPNDMVVVISHDLDAAGAVLAEALDGDAGYIGALGARRMQEARARWLADRGITDLTRIHGPAGLDIGAAAPGEVAVSVVAEAIAVRARQQIP